MKRLFSVLLGLVLVLIVSGPVFASYGAIAYSPSTGAYGYSHDWGTRGEAEEAALEQCAGDDARVVVFVHNGWAALARNSNGAWATGWSTRSRAEAERIAKANCRGGYGKTVVWIFSGTP